MKEVGGKSVESSTENAVGSFSSANFRDTKAALDEITDRASDCSALVTALNQKIKKKEISTAQVRQLN